MFTPRPKITIGIPTFNRVHYLRESLNSALAQSLHEIEIIVADNASTDGTEEYVHTINDARIKYIKHDKNYGPSHNFNSIINVASAEYFLWLNDDDMIFPDLTIRAYAAFRQNHEASMYSSYTLYSDMGIGADAQLRGPPFKLNWGKGTYRVINGNLLLPMCLFYTPTLFPGVLFRTDVIRNAYAKIREDCPLLNERIVIGHAAYNSKVIIDPYVGGWYRRHPGQMNLMLQRKENALIDSWYIMQSEIVILMNNHSDEILKDFNEYINEIPNYIITSWCQELSPFTQMNNISKLVFIMLCKKCGFKYDDKKDDKSILTSVKAVIRMLTLPILWNIMHVIKQYFHKK